MTKRSRTSRKLQSSWLVLPIAMVCAVVGVVAATKLRQSMAEIDAMRSWVEVPAIIRHADLKITASHDRGPPRTDSGPRLRRRFELLTAYDYVYTGRRYSGNRLSVYGNSETGDTMSRFLSNAYLELRRKRSSGEPFRCFVNPNRPSESILFGLIDLILLWIVAHLWFYRSVVEARPSGLMVQRGWFGLGRTRTIAADRIKQITTCRPVSAGTKVWKSIAVVKCDNKATTIAQAIEGTLEQQTVVDVLNEALGRRGKARTA